jgi:hypothetical protein
MDRSENYNEYWNFVLSTSFDSKYMEQEKTTGRYEIFWVQYFFEDF